MDKSQSWITRTFQSRRGDQRRKVIECVVLHTGLEGLRWEETQVWVTERFVLMGWV